jgi:cytochrome c
MTRTIFTAFAVVFLSAHAASAADPVRGERRFNALCGACHAVDPAQKKISAPMKGILGRKAATVERVPYSQALKDSGWTWDKEKLDAFLADPKKALPGTMKIIGAPNAEDRADIIAYLETLK